MKFSFILWGLSWLLKVTAWRHVSFKARLKEKNLIAQIKIADDSRGRIFIFKDGKVTSKAGIHPEPDICLAFKSAEIAVELLIPPVDYQQQIDAQKEFNLTMTGDDADAYWFAQTIMLTQNIDWKFGTTLPDGTQRFTSNTNGGPIFVYVKDDKIIRITPIEFDDTDPGTWTIEVRGKNFTPPRQSSLSPHGQNWKSMVYSPDRILTPLKRVDFDPNGVRNHQNRGKSGYESISWDEALDIVASEIQRVKRDYGPGSMA